MKSSVSFNTGTHSSFERKTDPKIFQNYVFFLLNLEELQIMSLLRQNIGRCHGKIKLKSWKIYYFSHYTRLQASPQNVLVLVSNNGNLER